MVIQTVLTTRGAMLVPRRLANGVPALTGTPNVRTLICTEICLPTPPNRPSDHHSKLMKTSSVQSIQIRLISLDPILTLLSKPTALMKNDVPVSQNQVLNFLFFLKFKLAFIGLFFIYCFGCGGGKVILITEYIRNTSTVQIQLIQ